MGQGVVGIPEQKPWDSRYGQPTVTVSGWMETHRAEPTSTGPSSGWGYICTYFDGPFNVEVELCIKAFTLELQGGGNYWTPGTVACGQGAANRVSPVA